MDRENCIGGIEASIEPRLDLEIIKQLLQTLEIVFDFLTELRVFLCQLGCSFDVIEQSAGRFVALDHITNVGRLLADLLSVIGIVPKIRVGNPTVQVGKLGFFFIYM